MSSSNPLEPIYRAYVVSSDCFKVVQRTVRRQQAALVQRTQFHGASEEDAKTAIGDAAQQAADLAILAPFATFERFVIEASSGRAPVARQRASDRILESACKKI